MEKLIVVDNPFDYYSMAQSSYLDNTLDYYSFWQSTTSRLPIETSQIALRANKKQNKTHIILLINNTLQSLHLFTERGMGTKNRVVVLFVIDYYPISILPISFKTDYKSLFINIVHAKPQQKETHRL